MAKPRQRAITKHATQFLDCFGVKNAIERLDELEAAGYKLAQVNDQHAFYDAVRAEVRTLNEVRSLRARAARLEQRPPPDCA